MRRLRTRMSIVASCLSFPILMYEISLFAINSPVRTQESSCNVQELRLQRQCCQEVDCQLLIEQDPQELCKWRRAHLPIIKADTTDCHHFKLRSGFTETVKAEEIDYPLAYSILAHKDMLHVVNLIEMLYTPHNLFCVHVDKQSIGLAEKLANFTKCFPNIFLADQREAVYWAGFPILRATLNCLQELTNRTSKWHYFINLSAQDFPLKTNLEMVKQLATWNNGSNMELIEPDARDKTRYSHSYDRVYNRFGHLDHHELSNRPKAPAPANLRVWKSNVAVMLHRSFTDWLLANELTNQLLEWLYDTDMPDEHFWATMMQSQTLYTTRQPYLARFAQWNNHAFTHQGECGGKYIRDVCVFGMTDLPRLLTLPHFFVNKLYANYQPAAYHCLRKRFLNRKLGS